MESSEQKLAEAIEYLEVKHGSKISMSISYIGPYTCHDGVTWPHALDSQLYGIIEYMKLPDWLWIGHEYMIGKTQWLHTSAVRNMLHLGVIVVQNGVE